MTNSRPKHTEYPQAVDNFLFQAARAQKEDAELSGLLVQNVTLEGECLAGLTLRDVTFSHCRFPGCDWSGSSFTDATFHICDLSGGNFEDTFWLRFALEDSKAMGVRLHNCRFRQGSFSQTRLFGANLDHGKLREVLFDGADLGGCFFTQCGFTGVKFQKCDLTQASFVHTPLKNVDLSTCQISGLTLSEDCSELRGAVVDLYQAADLARHFGITIKE